MRVRPSMPSLAPATGMPLVALLLLATTSCDWLQENLLMGESPPPGYIGGEIPREYDGKTLPFPMDDPRALEAGERIYRSYCLVCHGERGLGDGPQAPYLEPAPANFSAPPMLRAFREHPDYLFWWVSEGIPQTSMPAFKDRLTETERWQAITYSWHLGGQAAGGDSARGDGRPPQVPNMPLSPGPKGATER